MSIPIWLSGLVTLATWEGSAKTPAPSTGTVALDQRVTDLIAKAANLGIKPVSTARTPATQAKAMAGNITTSKNPGWIGATYKHDPSTGQLVSSLAQSLDAWSQAHPSATASQLTSQFTSLITAAPQAVRAGLSDHLAIPCRAVDFPSASVAQIKPLVPVSGMLKTSEGGLPKCHVQFTV